MLMDRPTGAEADAARGSLERHPVAEFLLSAWHAPHGAVDGSWVRMPPWRDGLGAVLAVTGRAAVVAPSDVTDAELSALGVDGWGQAHDPRVMSRLAGSRGWVDVLDAVLVVEGTGRPDPAVVPKPGLRHHPRVSHALALRDEVEVHGYEGDDETVLTLARGVGGLAELSFELAPARRGQGGGSALAAAARGLVPEGEPLVACVSPGNVASFRALLRAGFTPIGSVQLYRPSP
ncbi:N-acetyltransferase [Knoellia koreensis]|uniref:N-acetyltransferase n=1 Tax=Knoellia koreensis TaxID=2730921 RepID=A0A849HMX5_9MICO|nr:N-acetyltransferase [Knoellia sp. DB2414S]NNM48033.1 N-acetyltransferase [Knoellia sp. DB2414S]